ncbi:MAG: hypothetical protein QOE04_3330, partial [Mycobacterium sp.]|nr:hypothetical protein [Mycobacterium sp.]
MIVGSAEVTRSTAVEVTGSTATVEVTGSATVEVGWSVGSATVEVGPAATWSAGATLIGATLIGATLIGATLFGATLRRRTAAAWPVTATASWAGALSPRASARSRSRVGDSRLETDAGDAECAADRCCRDRMSDV